MKLTKEQRAARAKEVQGAAAADNNALAERIAFEARRDALAYEKLIEARKKRKQPGFKMPEFADLQAEAEKELTTPAPAEPAPAPAA